MIRVAVDAQAAAGQLTGLGVFTKNLIGAMTGTGDMPSSAARGDFNFHFYQDARYTTSTPKRLWWENKIFPALARQGRADLVHIPAFAPALCKRIKTVVTVHDLIGMLFPNQMGWASRLYWGKWLPLAVQQSDAIIADSQSTCHDLTHHLGVDEKKIRVIYPSGHEHFKPDVGAESLRRIRERLNLEHPYFIFVGTIEPRKNLSRVLSALARLSSKTPVKLVVVGSKDFAHGTFFRQVGRDFSQILKDVIFTGYLEHQELNSLYCGSLALVYPSLYEGFGIPILEAMASECPVITSHTSSTPEVAGSAALLVDPLSEQEIFRAMEKLMEQPALREQLKREGNLQIKKFSWQQTAEQTMEVYRSVLS